jgi:hypothetical protein
VALPAGHGEHAARGFAPAPCADRRERVRSERWFAESGGDSRIVSDSAGLVQQRCFT